MRRFLIIGQETAKAWVPEWYPLIRAARYLNVAPWDLVKQSVIWRLWADDAESAELAAAAHHKAHPKK